MVTLCRPQEILQSVLPRAIRGRNELREKVISEQDLEHLVQREIEVRRHKAVESSIERYLMQHRDRSVLFGRSLSCLPPHNVHRKRLLSVVDSKWFIRFIDLLIILNAIIFGAFNMNQTQHTDSTEYLVLYIVDVIFVVVFCAEIAIKIVVFGLRNVKCLRHVKVRYFTCSK